MMWILVILVIAVVYYSTNQKGTGALQIGKKTPEELLKERFVKGEIDESTYLQMKDTLQR